MHVNHFPYPQPLQSDEGCFLGINFKKLSMKLFILRAGKLGYSCYSDKHIVPSRVRESGGLPPARKCAVASGVGAVVCHSF